MINGQFIIGIFCVVKTLAFLNNQCKESGCQHLDTGCLVFNSVGQNNFIYDGTVVYAEHGIVVQ